MMSNKQQKNEEYMHVAGQVFLELVKKVYGTDNFAEIAPQIYNNPDNIIGEGISKYVYKIDGIDGYVLALIKREFEPTDGRTRFESCDMVMPKYNFGQVLFDNGHGLIVMKKIEGNSHSLKRWVNHSFDALEGKKPLSQEKAEEALLKICLISRMPMDAFNHLAMQIKYLNENSLPMDTINPNNILVDVENGQINLIDVFDAPKFLYEIKDPKNGVRNMEAVLLDSLLQTEYIKVLSPGKQELLKFASAKVIEKCQRAAENVGLINNTDKVHHYFELAMANSPKGRRSIDFIKHYENFVALYKDELAKDENIAFNREVNAFYERKEVDYLELKMNMLRKELGDKMGQTADKKTGKVGDEHHDIANRQVFIAKEIIKMRGC